MKKSLRFKKLRDIDPELLSEHAKYIAGLFDGDGAYVICLTRGKRVRFRPHISLSMTHEETIKFVADKFGVSYARGKPRKNRKIMYYLRVFRAEDLVTILEALARWSITKRQQVLTLLDFLERTPIGQRIEKEALLEQAEMYLKLKELNIRGKRPPNFKEWAKQLIEEIKSYDDQ